MPPDHYAAADELVIRLRARGLDSWADRINDVIDRGFTSTEILMGLRAVLQDLVDQEDELPSELRDEAKRQVVMLREATR